MNNSNNCKCENNINSRLNSNKNHKKSGQYDSFCDKLSKEYYTNTNIDDETSCLNNYNTHNIIEGFRDQELDNNDQILTSNERYFNSSIVGISASDDEALENYLKALAKNYDDIDRRIRNAERFVNQMEDPENSDYEYKNGFTSLKNYCSSPEKVEDNNEKYVSELRVSIADSINNGITSKFQDSNVIQTFIRQSHRATGDHNSPPIKKRSSVSIVPNSIKQNRSDKLQSVNCTSTLKNKLQNSGDLNADYEQIIIPPPVHFSSSYNEIDRRVRNKEVQTIDFHIYSKKLFTQLTLENRAVQTMASLNSLSMKTVDAAVGTDHFLPRKNSKMKYSNSAKFLQTSTPDISNISESDGNNLISESQTNGNFDSTNNNVSLKGNSLKTSNKDRKRRTRTHNPICVSGEADIQDFHKQKKLNLNQVKFIPRNEEKKVTDNKEDKKEQGQSTSVKGTEYPIEDCSKHASFEIQRLLEDLGTQLQATMSMREMKTKENHQWLPTETHIASFWDNPLNKKDLINSKKPSTYANTLKSNSKKKTKTKKKSNNINSELKEICRTMENGIKSDRQSQIIQSSSEGENDFTDFLQSKARSGKTIPTPNHTVGILKKSATNVNLTGDGIFPKNYKISKSFDLNPYDDIIKSHLSPIDRRLKSVASKNGCAIVIDGPINVYDIGSQAIRNKVMYRCTVAGVCKENLDKCVNYLKETFPNTFLKVNSRAG